MSAVDKFIVERRRGNSRANRRGSQRQLNMTLYTCRRGAAHRRPRCSLRCFRESRRNLGAARHDGTARIRAFETLVWGHLKAGQTIGELRRSSRASRRKGHRPMRALEEQVTAEQAVLLGKKAEAAAEAAPRAEDRHRRLRQGGSARRPSPFRRTRQRRGQAACI